MVQEVRPNAACEVPVLAPAKEPFRAERLSGSRAQEAWPTHRSGVGLLVDGVLPDAPNVVGRIAGLRHHDRTGPAVADHLACSSIGRIGNPLTANLHNPSCLPRRFGDRLRFGNRSRHRFLEVDVLPRPHGVARHPGVPVVGRRNDHDVHVVPSEQVLVGVMNVAVADPDHLLGAQLRTFVDVACGHDSETVVAAHHRQQAALQVPRPDVADAYDADLNACVRPRDASGRARSGCPQKDPSRRQP